jgi:hypothetical protein
MFNFFKSKKRKTSNELGAIIYQVIQMGLSHDELSAEKLIKELGLDEHDLIQQFYYEVTIALMFQSILAVEKKYSYPLAGDILDGMSREFVNHLGEMGVNDETVKITLTLFHNRMKEYYGACSNISGDGPAYWLGKKFYENLSNKKEDSLNTSLKVNYLIASNFLVSTLKGVDAVLEYIRIRANR